MIVWPERQPLQVGHARLDHEPAAALEMRGGVLEARDLRVLRDQVEDRVEDEVDERELPVDAGRREVADRDVDLVASRLRAQPRHHRLRAVDAGDAHAARGERQRDPAGADAELERATARRRARRAGRRPA